MKKKPRKEYIAGAVYWESFKIGSEMKPPTLLYAERKKWILHRGAWLGSLLWNGRRICGQIGKKGKGTEVEYGGEEGKDGRKGRRKENNIWRARKRSRT